MNFTWFKIFNLNDFNLTGLVSRTYTLELDGIGERDILVTKGNLVSMTYEGVMLAIQLNEKNPFIFDSHAAYLDEPTGDVYLGVPIAS